MRSKKPFFVASFLCGWTIVTYLLWMRQSTEVDVHRKHLLNKLNYLESSIKDEANLHDELVHKLVNVIKARTFSGTSTTVAAAGSNRGAEQDVVGGVGGLPIISSNGPIGSSVKEISLENNKFFFNDKLNVILQESRQHNFAGPVIPVLVFACNRVSVSKCLDNLIEYRPNPYQFPIIVSQVSRISFLLITIALPTTLIHLISQLL